MKRVLITGANGMVGQALLAELRKHPYDIRALAGRSDCDLLSGDHVHAVMQEFKPDEVYHLAAAVFGVGGNMKFPGEIFYRNTLMNLNVIEAARNAGATKIVAMGSAAIYADDLAQPMNEDDAMTGMPHDSEFGYAFSKRAMLVQLECYKQQYGLEYAYVIATNMYGPGDRFDPAHGHVVPSLIKKFLDAEKSGEKVEVWGNGSPTRDFLYAQDAAVGLHLIMQGGHGAINLASGSACPVRDLVEEIARNFPNVEYYWNPDRPLGQLKRSYDIDRLAALGFVAQFPLREGVKETVEWARAHADVLRG
jgi:GDP-L-fucose synthase